MLASALPHSTVNPVNSAFGSAYGSAPAATLGGSADGAIDGFARLLDQASKTEAAGAENNPGGPGSATADAPAPGDAEPSTVDIRHGPRHAGTQAAHDPAETRHAPGQRPTRLAAGAAAGHPIAWPDGQTPAAASGNPRSTSTLTDDEAAELGATDGLPLDLAVQPDANLPAASTAAPLLPAGDTVVWLAALNASAATAAAAVPAARATASAAAVDTQDAADSSGWVAGRPTAVNPHGAALPQAGHGRSGPGMSAGSGAAAGSSPGNARITNARTAAAAAPAAETAAEPAAEPAADAAAVLRMAGTDPAQRHAAAGTALNPTSPARAGGDAALTQGQAQAQTAVPAPAATPVNARPDVNGDAANRRVAGAQVRAPTSESTSTPPAAAHTPALAPTAAPSGPVAAAVRAASPSGSAATAAGTIASAATMGALPPAGLPAAPARTVGEASEAPAAAAAPDGEARIDAAKRAAERLSVAAQPGPSAAGDPLPRSNSLAASLAVNPAVNAAVNTTTGAATSATTDAAATAAVTAAAGAAGTGALSAASGPRGLARSEATAPARGRNAGDAPLEAGSTPALPLGFLPVSTEGQERMAAAALAERHTLAPIAPPVPAAVALLRDAGGSGLHRPLSEAGGSSTSAAGATDAGGPALPGSLAWVNAGPAANQPPAMAATDGRLDASPGSADFAPQLAARITTFVRDGLQQARLELNPAEMGPLTVQIQLDGNAARVHLAAEHAGTRAALEQAMPQLAGSLRESGLTLSGGGVFEQPRQPQQGAAGHPGGGANDNGRQPGSNAQAPGHLGATPTAAGSASTPTQPRLRHAGAVDLVA